MRPAPEDYVAASNGRRFIRGIVQSVRACGFMSIHDRRGVHLVYQFGAVVLTPHLLADHEGRRQLAEMRVAARKSKGKT